MAKWDLSKMTNDLQLPPGREPLRSDWFIEKLGVSQQQNMSLSVENMRLKRHVEKLEKLLLENDIEW